MTLALPEPTDLAAMLSRKALADTRIAEAAERYSARRADEEREAERRLANDRARLTAEAERALARRKAEMDAIVFSILDPDKIAHEPRRIIANIAAEHGITAADITGPSRKMAIVHIRWKAVVAVHQAHPSLSLPRLAHIFGGRDHTTILHALRARLGPDYRPALARAGRS